MFWSFGCDLLICNGGICCEVGGWFWDCRIFGELEGGDARGTPATERSFKIRIASCFDLGTSTTHPTLPVLDELRGRGLTPVGLEGSSSAGDVWDFPATNRLGNELSRALSGGRLRGTVPEPGTLVAGKVD